MRRKSFSLQGLQFFSVWHNLNSPHLLKLGSSRTLQQSKLTLHCKWLILVESGLIWAQIPRFLKITHLGHMRSNPIFFCSCVNPSLEFLEIIEFLVATLSSTTWNSALTKSNQRLLFNRRWEAQNANRAHKYTSQRLYFLLDLKTSFTAEGFRRFLLTYSNIRSSLVHWFPKEIQGPSGVTVEVRGDISCVPVPHNMLILSMTPVFSVFTLKKWQKLQYSCKKCLTF